MTNYTPAGVWDILDNNPDITIRSGEVPERPAKKKRSEAGTRDDLGRYFRSAWEANYARYLAWLQDKGEIQGWDYEPTTYHFPNQKRGAISYTPDFRIDHNDGTTEWVEIKGWMTPASRSKLRKMKKYHPEIKIKLIEATEYRQLKKSVQALIPNWE